MKSILILLIFLASLFEINYQSNGPIGDYNVEFNNASNKNYVITFKENKYSKVNSKGETIGKGKIIKRLKENGKGLIRLYDYDIHIPAGKIDSVEHITFKTEYTELFFSEKDTISFGMHYEGRPHISFQTGKMIRITK